MTVESVHRSERIERPADEVHGFAVDPANLPEWAPGPASSVENIDGRWFVETAGGRLGFAFVERNAYGVLDHDVTLPSDEVIYHPKWMIRDGDGCEAVFSPRRLPGMSDGEFERDAEAVSADLARLKAIMEAGQQA